MLRLVYYKLEAGLAIYTKFLLLLIAAAIITATTNVATTTTSATTTMTTMTTKTTTTTTTVSGIPSATIFHVLVVLLLVLQQVVPVLARQPGILVTCQAPANAAYDSWLQEMSDEIKLILKQACTIKPKPFTLSPCQLHPLKAKDYWLTLAAGLQVLGFTMLALDTSSSAAEASS